MTRASFPLNQQHCEVDLSPKDMKNLYLGDAEVSADMLLRFTFLQ